MVDGYDGSDYSDEGNPRYSQESSDSLPPLTFRTIWECPNITVDEMEDNDGKVIPCWRCGYCPIPWWCAIFQIPKCNKGSFPPFFKRE